MNKKNQSSPLPKVRKQKAEMDHLQERRNQINMMAKWRVSLADANNDEVNKLCDVWGRLCEGKSSLSETGRSGLRKLLSSFTFPEIAEAMKASINGYASDLKHENLEVAFNKIGGCARMTQIAKEHPEVIDFYKIRAMCRRRFSYVDYKIIQMLTDAFDSGVSVQDMKSAVNRCRKYSEFEKFIYELAKQRLSEEDYSDA